MSVLIRFFAGLMCFLEFFCFLVLWVLQSLLSCQGYCWDLTGKTWILEIANWCFRKDPLFPSKMDGV